MDIARYLLTALAATCSIVAAAQQSELGTSVVARNLYATITSAATIRPAALLLLEPSLPLAPVDGDLEALQGRLAELADSIPASSWIYSPSGETVSNIVGLVVKKGDFGSSEKVAGNTLTAAEQDLLFLDRDPTKPAPAYQAFNDLTQRIRDAEKSLVAEKDIRRRTQLELERAEATQRLNSLAHLNDLRQAARKLSPSSISSRQSIKDALQHSLDAYQGPTFFPPVEKWSDASGWVRVTVTLNGKPDDPVFAAPPSALRSSWWAPFGAQKLLANKATRLSFELKRIQVKRASLDLSFLSSSTWTLQDDTVISDGKVLMDGQVPSGRMPLVVSGFLLVRNISITTKLPTRTQQRQLTDVLQEGGLRFGTLSLAGRYVSNDADTAFVPAFSRNTVTSPELQVLALLCDQIPKAPSAVSTTQKRKEEKGDEN